MSAVMPEAVWVTLMGTHVHLEHDCQGIIDGHAEARSKGLPNYPPERYPVRLALRGFPRTGAKRTACAVCMPHLLGTAPVAGHDDPSLEQAAKSGEIAKLYARVQRWRTYRTSPSAPPPPPGRSEEEEAYAEDAEERQYWREVFDSASDEWPEGEPRDLDE